jgi:oxaloacetate decarboxylase gamma subunit
MDSLLITQGLDLMLFGMGTVFTFLTVLVGITTAMSAMVLRFAKDEVPEAHTSSNEIHTALVEPRIIKVIQTAIDQHRKS